MISHLLWLKAVALFTILLASLLGGLAPLLLREHASRLWVLALGNAFSGGVFLAGGVVHMTSAAIESFERYFQDTGLDSWVAEFPWAQGGIVVGILLIMVSETLVGHHHEHHEHTESTSLIHNEKEEHHHGVDPNEVVSLSKSGAKRKEYVHFVLFGVLSVHALIEGLAVGVQDRDDELAAIWLAIITHKAFESFGLGTACVKAQSTVKILLFIVIVEGLATPLGIILGDVLLNWVQGSGVALLTGIVGSIASGSFIYVSLVEVLARELADRTMIVQKVLLVVLGAGLMTLLAVWV